ncbi:helix-turn-helix domain-containing protein [Ursidibacter sp. B-7004-1]
MNIIDKIRYMREQQQWSQEEMAEKMNMSLNGYAKIERGETNLSIHKLKQIAMIFDVNVSELVNDNEKSNVFITGDNSKNNNFNNSYYGTEMAEFEIDRLNLIISHKNEIIEKLNSEILLLKELNKVLKK